MAVPKHKKSKSKRDSRRAQKKIEGPSVASCPECGEEGGLYDHSPERVWRHLDTCQFGTYLHARLPRVNCSVHGVKQVAAPWAELGSRFTLLFENRLIDILKECDVTGAGRIAAVSWDEGWGIMDRAVIRGMKRKQGKVPEYVGIDEKSFAKRHKYETLVCDLVKGTVECVLQERTQESLEGYWGQFSLEELADTEAIAMDMWEPYIHAVEQQLPQADIVHDKFHIAKYLGEAVDKVRKAENRHLVKQQDGTLKGTKYLWLTNPNHWTEQQQASFKDLKDKGLKVARAWSIKEMFSELWGYRYEKAAKNFFKKWHCWATHARLKPMAEVAKKLKRHLENILTYLKHRITNAVAEGLNSKIQQVKSAARGFRNFENFRIAILFFCGKLDMYPQKSQ